MKKHTHLIASASIIVLSVIGLILLRTVCSPCPTGMKCKVTTDVVSILLGVMVLMGLIGLFNVPLKVRLGQSIAEMGNLISMVVVMVLKGFCMKQDMRCLTITRPTIIVFLTFIGVAITVSLVANILAVREEAKNVSA